MDYIISNELKSDLERLYKNAGDLLNKLDTFDTENEREEIRNLIDHVKFKLMDIGGTLQKDIYNLDYLMSRDKLYEVVNNTYL